MDDTTATADLDLEFPGAPEALERQRPALMNLPASEVVPFRANVPQAVANVMHVAAAYAEDREAIADTFKPEAFAVSEFDDLTDRGQALWQADIDLRLAVDPEALVPVLVAEGTPLKSKLLRAGRYLWEHDLEFGPVIRGIIAGRGHLDLADDLTTLASLFSANWEWARDRSEVEAADLVRARVLGLSLLKALNPTPLPTQVAVLRDLRDRAGAHARAGVDEVRAAAAFVHRHRPQALERYPSVFASGSRRSPAPAREAADAEAGNGATDGGPQVPAEG